MMLRSSSFVRCRCLTAAGILFRRSIIDECHLLNLSSWRWLIDWKLLYIADHNRSISMVQCRLGWVTRITIMSKYFKNMFSKLFAALFSMSLANRLVSVALTSIFFLINNYVSFVGKWCIISVEVVLDY